jgi:hypothetical protein
MNTVQTGTVVVSQSEQIARVKRRLETGEGPRTAFVLMYRAANIANTMPGQDPFIVASALNDALIDLDYLSPAGLECK